MTLKSVVRLIEGITNTFVYLSQKPSFKNLEKLVMWSFLFQGKQIYYLNIKYVLLTLF